MEGRRRGTGANLKQERIARAAQRVVGDLGIPAVKHGMDLNGYFGGLARLPLLPLTGEVKSEVEALLSRHQELIGDPDAWQP